MFSLPSTVTDSSEVRIIIFAHTRPAKVPHQSGRVRRPSEHGSLERNHPVRVHIVAIVVPAHTVARKVTGARMNI